MLFFLFTSKVEAQTPGLIYRPSSSVGGRAVLDPNSDGYTSAGLEVSSSGNNKGSLIPRISASQKDAIVSPAQGLLVYQTTTPIGFYYFTGTSWKFMANATDLTAGALTGIVAIANGGTYSKATATAEGIGYGIGTAQAFTGAGTSGQILSSNGTGVPTWITPSGGGIKFVEHEH